MHKLSENGQQKAYSKNLHLPSVLEDLHNCLHEMIDCKVKRKPYLKAHYDASNSRIEAMNSSQEMDLGAQLLAALDMTSDVPDFPVTECSVAELSYYTGFDYSMMRRMEDCFSGDTRCEIIPAARALFFLKLVPEKRHLQKRFRAALTEERRLYLTEEKILPIDSLDALEVGWCDENCCATIPQRNGFGDICSFVQMRKENELKYEVIAFPLGLILPTGWRKRRGSLLITAGAMETAGLHALGYRVIGRANERASLVDLAILLRSVSGDIVLIEDGNSNEKQVEDARYLSCTLSTHLGRTIPAKRWNEVISLPEVSQNFDDQ